jgi:signal transduction histidine kinase
LSLNRNYEEAGLGLPIVRDYVKLLNGRVEIKSQKGKGTRVECYIPFVL